MEFSGCLRDDAGVLPEDQETLDYLRQALKVLQNSLLKEPSVVEQGHLIEYIRDIQARIGQLPKE